MRKPGGHSTKPRPITGTAKRSGAVRSTEARRAYDRQFADAQREVDAHNAHIDEMEAGLRANDRHAVSEYVQKCWTAPRTRPGSRPSAVPGIYRNPPC